jgi:trk system potassium uptake protein
MEKIINFKVVLSVLSRNLFISAAALQVCIGVALIYSEPVGPFLITSIITFSFGGIFYLVTRNAIKNAIIQRRDAYLTVTLSWLVIGLTGALPYLISGSISSVTDAVFESVSGFTTTGSSILVDIESLPKSILFWRSLTHWIGGIGIIVLVIVVMPSLHIGSYQLFTMESSLQEKIQVKIKSVGKRLLLIYIVLTVAEVLLLLLGKMDLYESICHAFGTVATGGFSPKNTSLSGYSPYIQYVVMIFMVLAGTNFAIHYYLFKRDFGRVKENEEIRFYLLTILTLGIAIASILFYRMDMPVELSLRESFFQVISIVTCTGYATADYMVWPEYAWLIIFFAMFLGGCTGSTSGGIKMIRHLLLLKNIGKTFREMIHPNAIIPLRLNKSSLNESTNNSIIGFIFAYFMIFVVGSIVLILLRVDIKTACSSVATCMAGIGPGIGTVGPVGNFAHLSDAVKLILSFLMIIGRLEIYTVLILFSGAFWKN